VYPSIDVQNILDIQIIALRSGGKVSLNLMVIQALAVTHVVNYMKYASSLNVLHEDVLMKIFVSSLESSQRSWLAHSCDPKSIPSSTNLIEEFLRHCRPATQNLQDTFQELKDALYREGFLVDDETINEEWKTEEEYHPPIAEEVLEEQIHEESCQEDLNDEDSDETSVSIISLDEGEVVLPHLPPAHEDEEMIT
jgi:hypothetical protein